jgi:beta-lactamase regulating signal transducer with metallopeptidase domain
VRQQVSIRTEDAAERYWWLRTVLPSLTIVGALIGLLAWGLVEPLEAERLAFAARLATLPLCLVVSRALIRAVVALMKRPRDVPAATIGILRPRIVISGRLRARLDDRALAAVVHHEKAHARHRDPLRIWVAQLATDLRWPLTGASLGEWREALEIARDDEAVAQGMDGPDLAAAIIAAAALRGEATGGAAALLGPKVCITVRVRRLLEEPSRPAGTERAVWTIPAVALTLFLSISSSALVGNFIVDYLLS